MENVLAWQAAILRLDQSNRGFLVFATPAPLSTGRGIEGAFTLDQSKLRFEFIAVGEI